MNGENYHLPCFWWTEASTWVLNLKVRLWVARIQWCLGLGFNLDRFGKLPSNRMQNIYKNEKKFVRFRVKFQNLRLKKIINKVIIELFWSLKTKISQEWSNLRQGFVLSINSLKNTGVSVNYMVPQEGAFSWLDGLLIPKRAETFDQIYAFLDYIYWQMCVVYWPSKWVLIQFLCEQRSIWHLQPLIIIVTLSSVANWKFMVAASRTVMVFKRS